MFSSYKKRFDFLFDKLRAFFGQPPSRFFSERDRSVSRYIVLLRASARAITLRPVAIDHYSEKDIYLWLNVTEI
jgi:hypothetical protein